MVGVSRPRWGVQAGPSSACFLYLWLLLVVLMFVVAAFLTMVQQQKPVLLSAKEACVLEPTIYTSDLTYAADRKTHVQTQGLVSTWYSIHSSRLVAQATPTVQLPAIPHNNLYLLWGLAAKEGTTDEITIQS